VSVLPRQLPEIGASIVAVGAAAVLALGAAWVAAGTTNWMAGVAIMLAPAVAVAAVVVPRLGVALLAALVMANAGLVLMDSASLPDVERGVSVLLAIGILFDRRAVEVLEATPWLIGLFVAFAAARMASAFLAPAGADWYSALKDLAFGALLILVVAWAIGRQRGLWWAAFAAVATGALMSILSAAKLLLGVDSTFFGFAADVILSDEELRAIARSLEQPSQLRAAGPIGDPNYFAQSLVLMLPLGMWLARRAVHGWARLVMWACCGAMLVGIGITQSRGGMIALAVALTVLMAIELPRGKRAYILLVPVVAAGALYLSGTYERVGAIADVVNPREAEDFSIRGRTSEALVAIDMFREQPLTGVGTDNYPPLYREYSVRFGLDDRYPREPHNSYLEMAAESGILGVLTFVAMLVAALLAGLSSQRALRRLGRVESGAAAAMVAGLAGYMTAALFLDQFFPNYLWLAFGMIIGLAIIARRAAAGERRLT